MSKQITITLSTEQVNKLAQLRTTREGKSDEELIAQCIDRGQYDLLYRTKRNKEQYRAFKEWKEMQKQ